MHKDHLGQRARICQLEVACSYRLRRRRLNRGVQFSHLKAIKLATSQREREREGTEERESKVAEEVPAPKADNYTRRIGFSAWSLSLM